MTNTWAEITANFKALLETAIGGWRESDLVDLSRKDGASAGAHHKSYSILSGGMPKPTQYVNAEADIVYTVRLQLCFEINEQDQKASYNQAVADAEAVVKRRIDTGTWGALVQVQHQSTSALLPAGTAQSHSFSYITIDFQATGRDFIAT